MANPHTIQRSDLEPSGAYLEISPLDLRPGDKFKMTNDNLRETYTCKGVKDITVYFDRGHTSINLGSRFYLVKRAEEPKMIKVKGERVVKVSDLKPGDIFRRRKPGSSTTYIRGIYAIVRPIPIGEAAKEVKHYTPRDCVMILCTRKREGGSCYKTLYPYELVDPIALAEVEQLKVEQLKEDKWWDDKAIPPSPLVKLLREKS